MAYKEETMDIIYPNEAPVFDGANLTVRFLARVGSELVVCEISAEALEDHFGADSSLESALLDAFERGQEHIQSVCTDALQRNGGVSVMLRSGLFRMEGVERNHGTV